MRPQEILTVTLVNDPNGIFEDQGGTGAGLMTLNGILVSGGIAYLYGPTSTQPQAQRISVEGTGNNSSITLTIVGTGGGGESLTEVLTLANNGTATTDAYFRTVTSMTRSGTITGNIEAGWLSANGAVTREFYTDRWQSPYNNSLAVYLSSGAAMTWTVQHTLSNKEANYSPSTFAASATWVATDGMSGVSATGEGNLAYPAVAVRLLISAYTSGTAMFICIQGGP